MDIQSIVEKYIVGISNKNIFTDSRITNKLLKKHFYCVLDEDETPLVVINKGGLLMTASLSFTGLVITNKRLHYLLMKEVRNSKLDSILLLFAKKITGAVFLEQELIQIGLHDKSREKAYLGHQLIVNNESLGLIRMGEGIFYDEGVIKFINGLFSELAAHGILKREPVEYTWHKL